MPLEHETAQAAIGERWRASQAASRVTEGSHPASSRVESISESERNVATSARFWLARSSKPEAGASARPQAGLRNGNNLAGDAGEHHAGGRPGGGGRRERGGGPLGGDTAAAGAGILAENRFHRLAELAREA